RIAVPTSVRLQIRPWLAGGLLLAAIVVTIYGLVNARRIRLRRVPIKLANLPAAWVGRTALVVSDIHLGNINGERFARRIAAMARQLDPDIIFIPGDLFDGMKVNPERIAAPLYKLAPPLGVYFVTGNHDEFGGAEQYCDALRRAGIQVIDDKSTVIDGVVIAGVGHRTSTHLIQLRHLLTSLDLREGVPSILLQHVPHRLPMLEQAGASLLLSGHTHCGQTFPFTLIARRAFGEYTYGLRSFGALQVYTSCGAGTWGPPMRVGTHSEMALLTFA
ncbi:MAG: metallophosphoesterase, partial [Terracidiphilus sp.]